MSSSTNGVVTYDGLDSQEDAVIDQLRRVKIIPNNHSYPHEFLQYQLATMEFTEDDFPEGTFPITVGDVSGSANVASLTAFDYGSLMRFGDVVVGQMRLKFSQTDASTSPNNGTFIFGIPLPTNLADVIQSAQWLTLRGGGELRLLDDPAVAGSELQCPAFLDYGIGFGTPIQFRLTLTLSQQAPVTGNADVQLFFSFRARRE